MNDLTDFYDASSALIRSGVPHVVVCLVEGEGSIPSDVGSRMIVVKDQGRHWGTVGGGRVEAAAIDYAQGVLAGGSAAGLVRWNLNTDLGMTCGGRLAFFFEPVRTMTWPIVIFGAAHVCQALCGVLRTLTCQVTVYDPRPQWVERLPAGIDGRCEAFDPSVIATLPERAFLISMTQGHSHDLPVLAAIASSGREFPYVGVIGSKSKAGALRRELREIGAGTLAFQCPIGLPIGRNHPAEIAISVAGELLQRRGQST